MPWPSSAVNSGPRRLLQARGITETRRNSQPTCSTAFCLSPVGRPDLQSQDKSGCEILTDAAWAVWEPLIEQVRPRGKTPPKELRRTISAIFWRHQNGAKWRSIPTELGPWWLAAQLFIRWAKQGVWERLLDLVQQHDIALGMSFLDGTNIRAHHKAAGAQKRGSTATSEMCARRLAALAAAMAQKPA